MNIFHLMYFIIGVNTNYLNLPVYYIPCFYFDNSITSNKHFLFSRFAFKSVHESTVKDTSQ